MDGSYALHWVCSIYASACRLDTYVVPVERRRDRGFREKNEEGTT
jgi:hypothetical protein